MSRLIHRLFRIHAPQLLKDEEAAPLINALNTLIDQQEKDRLLLESSMTVMSDELQEINEQLKTQLNQQKTTQQQLKRTLAQQKALLDTTPEAVFHFSAENTLVSSNRAGRELLERYPVLAGNSIPNTEEDWLRLFNDALHPMDKVTEIFSKDEAISGRHETKDGCHFEYNAHSVTLDGKYDGRVICIREITNFIKNQKQLEFQAHHDTLTLLPNRLFLVSSLRQSIQKASARTRIAVMTIDIDDFKKINDTAGHLQGDRFLVRIADQLNSIISDKDVLGRVGGDEFLIVINNVQSQRELISIHKKIIKIFENPFQFGENAYRITCSIGISLYSQDDTTADRLIQKSNLAMQKAKSVGKNTFHYFDSSLERIAHHRVDMELKLADAIKNDELSIHFQPKVDLINDQVVGAEALIRWTPENQPQIYPDQFIPIAEENGMIRDITRWVIDRSCRYLVDWRGTVLEDLPISINVSALDLIDQSFATQVNQIINSYSISPELIEFELTESALYKDAELAKSIIHQLRQRGFKLALDDFGTGFSSLSYLQELEVDTLKIDKSFVQGMNEEPKRYSIVKSIIEVGLNLGLTVISEGVETETERDTLCKLGNKIGQGYLFSKPITADKLCQFVEDKKPCHSASFADFQI